LLIVSKKFMDKLEPRDQEIVRAAGQPAVDAQTDAILSSEEATIASLREKGLQVLQLENRKAFSDKVETVYKEASEWIGADLIEQARKFATT
jgi:TRAP-type C4-dicarboxylate transport system substrate-binding protein